MECEPLFFIDMETEPKRKNMYQVQFSPGLYNRLLISYVKQWELLIPILQVRKLEFWAVSNRLKVYNQEVIFLGLKPKGQIIS